MRNIEKESELLMRLVKNKLEKHKRADSLVLELLEAHAGSSKQEACISSTNLGIPQETSCNHLPILSGYKGRGDSSKDA